MCHLFLYSLCFPSFFSIPHSLVISSCLVLFLLTSIHNSIPSSLPLLHSFPKTTGGETSWSQRKEKETQHRKGIKATLPPSQLSHTGSLSFLQTVLCCISMSLHMLFLFFYFPYVTWLNDTCASDLRGISLGCSSGPGAHCAHSVPCFPDQNTDVIKLELLI